MVEERITREEAKSIEREYAQVKREIVEFLKEDSELGSTRESIENDSKLPPAQTYSLLLELENEGKIEVIAGQYFVKE